MTATAEAEVKPVQVRSCDGCTMCCKLLSIKELEKPRLQWCVHCDIGVGCKIYEQRPAECRNFYCGYLMDAKLGDHWKPSRSKMVIVPEGDANRIAIHVDPGRVGAWRKEPYYSEIKNWAVAALEYQGQVIVWEGQDVIAILPDREKNLGPVGEDQFIITSERAGVMGVELDVMVVDKDDPILEKLKRPTMRKPANG